jgi:hypothetical protein
MFSTTLLASGLLALGASAQTYKASFTEYGSGDQNNSGNCNVKTTACGYYTQPGYSAAVSQNEFGAGPGQGAGPACGTCCTSPLSTFSSLSQLLIMGGSRADGFKPGRLTIETDSSGNKVSNAGNSIVVKVTNLCPADGNPLCAQNGLSGTNQYGANLNFDTVS